MNRLARLVGYGAEEGGVSPEAPAGEVPHTDTPAVAQHHAPSEEAIVAALREVHDPEIPVNIYDLGLIYRIDIRPSGKVAVDMTLTAPACPVAGLMPVMVSDAVKGVEGVADVDVELVWDPPWGPERMSEEARLQLGLM